MTSTTTTMMRMSTTAPPPMYMDPSFRCGNPFAPRHGLERRGVAASAGAPRSIEHGRSCVDLQVGMKRNQGPEQRGEE